MCCGNVLEGREKDEELDWNGEIFGEEDGQKWGQISRSEGKKGCIG